MMHAIGRLIGMGMQIIGAGLVINDHPNPLLYDPFFGSFNAEKIGGILIALAGVLIYRVFGGEYSLIKYGFND